MKIKITYDKITEILAQHYKKIYADIEFEIKCYRKTTTTPDGYGFFDEHHSLNATIKVNKKVTVFGKVEEVSEEVVLDELQIGDILKNALEQDNLVFRYIYDVKKNSVTVAYDTK